MEEIRIRNITSHAFGISMQDARASRCEIAGHLNARCPDISMRDSRASRCEIAGHLNARCQGISMRDSRTSQCKMPWHLNARYLNKSFISGNESSIAGNEPFVPDTFRRIFGFKNIKQYNPADILQNAGKEYNINCL
jgi:hypothetical protein